MLGIGDFDKVNRRKVKTRLGQVFYMGKKYTVDPATGYYVCTTGDRKRLHVAMWEHEWGKAVPPGCVIHHMDWVKTHNEIDNLICLTQDEHNSVHNPPGGALETASSERVIKLTQELLASRVCGVPGGLDK